MSALFSQAAKLKEKALHTLRTHWLTTRFVQYRQRRQQSFGMDLSGLICPGIPNLVSIILPVYNGADLLPSAIDSILAQDHPHWELIILNDGSQDETPQLAESYAARDPRIRVIHQENRKIPKTLSRGFRLARGEFLTWTSADNRLRPSFLRQMLDCLVRHPHWDLIYADQDLIDAYGQPLRNSDFFSAWQQPVGSEHLQLPMKTELLHAGSNFVGAAFLYRSRVAHLLGDYSSQRFTVEDYDYWLICNTLLSLHHADFSNPVYEYRFHDNSLTARAKELRISTARERLLVFDGIRQQLCLTPLSWICEGSESTGSSTLRKELCDQLSQLGHTLLTRRELSQRTVPSQLHQVVYLQLGHSFECLQPPPPSLPSGVLTAFLLCDDTLPTSAHTKWNVVAALGPGQTPKLMDGYQGLLRADTVTTLIRALDCRSRAELLRRYEQRIKEPAKWDTVTVLLDGDMPDSQLRAVIHSLLLQQLCAQPVSQDDASPKEADASQQLAPTCCNLEVLLLTRTENAHAVKACKALTTAQIGTGLATVKVLHLSDCPARWQLAAAVAESSGAVVVALDRPLQSRRALTDLWDQLVQHPELALLLSSPSARLSSVRTRAFAGRRQPLLEIGALRSTKSALFPSALSQLEARSQLQRLGYQVAHSQLHKPRSLTILPAQLRAAYEVISQSLQGQ